MRKKTLSEEIPQTKAGLEIYIAECEKEMKNLERARRKAQKKLALIDLK